MVAAIVARCSFRVRGKIQPTKLNAINRLWATKNVIFRNSSTSAAYCFWESGHARQFVSVVGDKFVHQKLQNTWIARYRRTNMTRQRVNRKMLSIHSLARRACMQGLPHYLHWAMLRFTMGCCLGVRPPLPPAFGRLS